MGFEGVKIQGIRSGTALEQIHGFSGISFQSLELPERLAFDVVDQYNYAKVTPLKANHGVLINYTDEELGIADISQQTGVKDFYDKVKFQDVQFQAPVQAKIEDNIEIAGGFAPRVKALTFNGTSQYILIPTFLGSGAVSSVGNTIIFGIKKHADTFKNYETIVDGTIGNPHNSIGTRLQAYNRASYYFDKAKLSDVNMVTVLDGDTSIMPTNGKSNIWLNGTRVDTYENGNIGLDFSGLASLKLCRNANFTNRGLEGQLLYFAWFQGILPKKYLLELTNNTLLKNPSLELQRKYSLELFIDFNNPFDDAGTLKFPDLSKNAHDVIAYGYSDLATLKANLVDINSLR